MLKTLELARRDSCLNKAAHDEPVFVLRAKDPHAAQTVRLWAAMSHGAHCGEKIDEAIALADEIDAWRVAHQLAAQPFPSPFPSPFYPPAAPPFPSPAAPIHPRLAL